MFHFLLVSFCGPLPNPNNVPLNDSAVSAGTSIDVQCPDYFFVPIGAPKTFFCNRSGDWIPTRFAGGAPVAGFSTYPWCQPNATVCSASEEACLSAYSRGSCSALGSSCRWCDAVGCKPSRQCYSPMFESQITSCAPVVETKLNFSATPKCSASVEPSIATCSGRSIFQCMSTVGSTASCQLCSSARDELTLNADGSRNYTTGPACFWAGPTTQPCRFEEVLSNGATLKTVFGQS